MLILGRDLVAFLRRGGPRTSGPASRAKSIACDAARRRAPAGDMADYQPVTATLGNLIAICSDCEAMMYRRVSLAKLEQVRGKLDITMPQALPHIDESAQPSVNSDLRDRKHQTMTTHNADNERIKRRYFAYLKEAKRHSEPTGGRGGEGAGAFRGRHQYRDFKAFHFEQAIAFKRHLAEQRQPADRGEAEQGDAECHARAPETLLPVAGGATGLQVAPAVFRRRLLQPVGQGHAHRDRPARTGRRRRWSKSSTSSR